LALAGRASLYSIAVSEAASITAACAAHSSPYLLAAALAAAALPLAGLYWLSILLAGSVSLVALYLNPGPVQLAALLTAAAAALLAPRPIPRPPAKLDATVLVLALLAVLAPIQVALAVHALESVEPYSFMVQGVRGAPGTLFAMASLAVAVAAYLAAKPPHLPAPPAGASLAQGVLEAYIYTATLLPAVKAKSVVAAFLAGITAAGLASLAGRPKLRLLAYLAAYLATAYLTGASRAVESFYTP
jgi:hypothetical protein